MKITIFKSETFWAKQEKYQIFWNIYPPVGGCLFKLKQKHEIVFKSKIFLTHITFITEVYFT